MSTTDSPLKSWARENIADIVGWLLGQKAVTIHEETIELGLDAPPRLDLVYRLELTDGRICIFHLEFQGRRSKPPMPRRQLNHLLRLSLRYEWPILIESFVLYVEKYAGEGDNGRHQINRLDGTVAINWNYTPIHLWREPADSLLALDHIGIIPLAALMDIQEPEKTLPAITQRILAVPEKSKQMSLFASLLALISDEEHTRMIETLIESDEFIIDSPFLRRIRQEAATEAKKEAKKEAAKAAITAEKEVAKATVKALRIERQEGQQEGLQKGFINASCLHTLKIFAARFDPPVSTYLETERKLHLIKDQRVLDELFTAVLNIESAEEFTAVFDDTSTQKRDE